MAPRTAVGGGGVTTDKQCGGEGKQRLAAADASHEKPREDTEDGTALEMHTRVHRQLSDFCRFQSSTGYCPSHRTKHG